jgi:hypothetical protein
LLIGENPQPTPHPRIMKAHEACLPWAELEAGLDELGGAIERNDVSGMRRLLQQLVNGYRPEADIIDWVHIERETKDSALADKANAEPHHAERQRVSHVVAGAVAKA